LRKACPIVPLGAAADNREVVAGRELRDGPFALPEEPLIDARHPEA
jgi:hypothetical protein